ncbi:MAG: hypothetical protein ACXABY_34840 [Candidatus Thorarchaeota archaeon]|jgi:hypothetical protein
MTVIKGTKNKLFKGLTEHDVLTFEEEKMRFQRRQGRKVTDLEFLRHLLMSASRPVISVKEGVSDGFLAGSRPIYDKNETLLEKFRGVAKE